MINKSKKSQTFEQGAAILFISGIFVKIIGALFKIPLSSDYCLGDIGFGYFSSVYDIYLPIYTLASSGIPSSVSRIISEYLAENDYKKVQIAFGFFKKIMFLIGFIGTFILLLLTIPFVKFTDKTGNTLYTYILMCPAVLFTFLSSYLRGFFEGNRNMIPTAVSNIIDALSKILIGFTAAFITIKLTNNFALASAAAIGGIALGTIVSYLFLNFYRVKHYKTYINKNESKTVDRVLINKLFKICIPIVVSSFAIGLIPFIDSLTINPILNGLIESENNISIIFSSTKIDKDYIIQEIPSVLYGIKSKAYTIFNLIPVFAGFIASCALPSITNDIITCDNIKAEKTVNSALKITSILSFPLGFGLLFIGTPIMRLLFGENSSYLGGRLLSYYGVAALFAGMVMVLSSILQASDKQNVVLTNIITGLILKTVSNIILVSISSVNIYGAGYSTIIGLSYIVLSNFFCLFKEKSIKIFIYNSILKPFISAFACGLSAFFISKINNNSIITIFSILVAGGIYIIFLYCFKTFSLKEIKELLGKND